MPRILTVVPGPKNGDGVHVAQGTQILLADGSKLEGVRAVALSAESVR